MKSILTFLAGLSLATLSLAAQPLLSPQELQPRLNQVRVIDIREAKAYETGHIAGAVNAPYAQWRGEPSNPGELPARPKLTQLVQSLGLSPSTHAVIVSTGADATDFGATARVYWTLKVLGLKELSILNGGLKAWTEAKLPQSTEAAKVVASNFAPQIDKTYLATREEVVQRVKSGSSVLLDARPTNFFLGEARAPAAKVAGTLPTAVNFTHDKWFAPGSASFVSVDQARQIAASAPINPAKETVSFCNTGHWAATNWFAVSEVLGQKNVKLYAGSMVDWTQDPNNLPVANTPGRAQQLLNDAKVWTQQLAK